jgi:hypothetical protein
LEGIRGEASSRSATLSSCGKWDGWWGRGPLSERLVQRVLVYANGRHVCSQDQASIRIGSGGGFAGALPDSPEQSRDTERRESRSIEGLNWLSQLQKLSAAESGDPVSGPN